MGFEGLAVSSAMAPKQRMTASEKHWRNKLANVLTQAREKLGPDGIARCLVNALSGDELAKMRNAEVLEADRAKAQFAEAIVERSHGSESVRVAVASAAQESIGGWSRARKFLKVPGKRLWRRVQRQQPKQAAGRKSKVDRRPLCDKVRAYLLENSSTTGKLIRAQGMVQPVYNLNASKHKLWLRSEAMQRLLPRTTWYQHLAKHHRQFVRLKCRTDVCVFCHKYDKVLLLPELRRELSTRRGGVEAVDAEYFRQVDEHWAKMKAAGRTDPDDTLSLQYIKFLKLFMDKTAEAA